MTAVELTCIRSRAWQLAEVLDMTRQKRKMTKNHHADTSTFRHVGQVESRTPMVVSLRESLMQRLNMQAKNRFSASNPHRIGLEPNGSPEKFTWLAVLITFYRSFGHQERHK